MRWASKYCRPGALVDRREAVGLERVGVVARADQQVAGGVEGQRAGGVAAAVALQVPGEDHLLAGEADRVVDDREARDALRRGRDRCGRRVGDVDVAGRVEVRRELDAQAAVLEVGVDRDLHGRRDGAVDRVPDVDLARHALDVEDAAVVGHVELHRALRVVVDRDLLEVVELGLASRGSPQSASTAPAAVWMPPSRWPGSRARRRRPGCGPCPCTRRGRRRTRSTTRSGGRRPSRCRRPRRTSTRRPSRGP